jgi:6-pyruvoyl-tetrahydropterin synthase
MPKWKLTTEFTFDAAHYIRDYDGPCGRMHGHTYRVRIEATLASFMPQGTVLILSWLLISAPSVGQSKTYSKWT